MLKHSLFTLAIALITSMVSAASPFCGNQDSVFIRAEDSERSVLIGNNQVSLKMCLSSGLFDIFNNNGDTVATDAYYQAGGLLSKHECSGREYTESDISDQLGKGKALTVKMIIEDYADIIWQVILYEKKDFFVFRMGIDNDCNNSFRLSRFAPFICRDVFPLEDKRVAYKILTGEGGGDRTRVTESNRVTSFNNLMVRFGKADSISVVVAGGLTYNEFEKFVMAQLNSNKNLLYIKLLAEDHIGKLIDPGKTYLPDERFYLCFNDDNPFEALEKYGQTLKTAQRVKLNYYDFPTECLWYATVYHPQEGREKFNNTKGAVKEMEIVARTDFLKYSPVAIRLVPDAYGDNNQQGWWDDEHWAKYYDKASSDFPNYSEPYLSSRSWGEKISEMGGLPFTYFQSGRRSEDFVKEHPEYMLFNDPYHEINMADRFLKHLARRLEYYEIYRGHWWANREGHDMMLSGYDFTDPDFIIHMKKVYDNLREAGIKGIMYDYPEGTAWSFEGGFEDKYATTAWAYRNMFKLAYEGLGGDCYLNERNLLRGSDITLGLVASQRVWGDTDQITPEMVTRCGLRWYKNRTVVNYDMDSKDPTIAKPAENNDGSRSMFTMAYVTSGRFLLGCSFAQLTDQQLYDLSRIYPFNNKGRSARPLDAFNDSVTIPRIYDFVVNNNWHQLCFYNYILDSKQPERNIISVDFSKSLKEGGMQLDKEKYYYVYDFWNDHFVGKFRGDMIFSQELRPGEARMMSVHAREDTPQIISTNRHIMQGFLDISEQKWLESKNTLKATSEVIGNEVYSIVVATNNHKLKKCKAKDGKCSWKTLDMDNGIIEIKIIPDHTGLLEWELLFSSDTTTPA